MDDLEKQNRAQGLLQAWYERPVFLASSSKYRANKMMVLGFEDVRTEIVPDVVEEFAQKQWENQKRDPTLGFTEIDGPVFIARKKVEYLLAKVDALPKDASVCAFDTMPMRFRANNDAAQKNEKRVAIWKVEHLNKPKDLNEARRMIRETFETVIRGNLDFLAAEHLLIQEGYSGKLLKDSIVEMKKKYLSRLIKVKTGGAIRLAGNDEIDLFSVEANLEIGKVCGDLDASLGMGESLLRLTEEVIEIMEETGAGVTKVSGGIDYYNQEIRKLLAIKDFDMENFSVESGVFRGMPLVAFWEYLKLLAKRTVEEKA